MTQKQRLAQHFKTEKYITAKEAFEKYGIARLAARAQEMGLVSEMVNGVNRYGDKVKFAKYRMA